MMGLEDDPFLLGFGHFLGMKNLEDDDSFPCKIVPFSGDISVIFKGGVSHNLPGLGFHPRPCLGLVQPPTRTHINHAAR